LAQIGGIAVNELQLYTPDPGACAASSEDFSGNVYGFGHMKIYEDIVACMRGTRPYPVAYEDTLATISLLNSLYVAHESRSWVDVALAGDSARLGRPDDALASLYRSAAP
jgi:UDP-N-acetyl-2-amino-2-deoxyglucuronate dehydrogenase